MSNFSGTTATKPFEYHSRERVQVHCSWDNGEQVFGLVGRDSLTDRHTIADRRPALTQR